MPSCNKDNPEYIEALYKRVESISKTTEDYFNSCSSTTELKEYLSTIKKIEGVKKTYISGDALFVDIRGWGKIAYIYPHEYDFDLDEEQQQYYSNLLTKAQTKAGTYVYKRYRVCIGNQLLNNNLDNYSTDSNIASALVSLFQIYGVECSVSPPSIEWLLNDEFNYDSAILLTHGFYDDGHHWLLTSDEIGRSELTKDFEEWEKEYKEDIIEKRISVHDLLRPCCVKEERNGILYRVWYIAVSELFLDKMNATSGFSGRNPHIVFNVACNSLDGSNSLADVYIKKGTDYYLGYDGANSIGPKAMADLFAKLLEGKSFEESLSSMKYKNDPKGGVLGCVSYIASYPETTYILPPIMPSHVYNPFGDYIQINRGNYPPNIEGEYIISPNYCMYDENDYYSIGQEVPPIYIRISKQNEDNLSVSLEVICNNGLEHIYGEGCLGGNGKNFTAYFDCQGTGTGYAYDNSSNLYSFEQHFTCDVVISGTVNQNSIDNLQYGWTVESITVDPSPNAIVHVTILTTEIFRDGDGVSSYFPFPSTAYFKSPQNRYTSSPLCEGELFLRKVK